MAHGYVTRLSTLRRGNRLIPHIRSVGTDDRGAPSHGLSCASLKIGLSIVRVVATILTTLSAGHLQPSLLATSLKWPVRLRLIERGPLRQEPLAGTSTEKTVSSSGTLRTVTVP